MDSNTDLHKTQLLERMKQRTEDLAAKAEERKIQRDISAAENENAEYFHCAFSEMKEHVEKKIQRIDEIEKQNLRDYFDDLIKDIHAVQRFLNESSMFLAAFKIKKAQEDVTDLNKIVQSKMEEIQPKKRFGFRSKKNTEKGAAEIKKRLPKEEVDGKDSNKSALDKILERQFFGFNNEVGKHLTKSAEEVNNRQLNLVNLRDCRVEALGNPASLQIASLVDCTVILGPASRSAFIKECHNCTFVLACQQVRIHDTKNSNFYLHVTGAAIIENCSKVRFAPYTLNYDLLSEHFALSGLNQSVNYWDKIEDFKWLNENEASPNWSVLKEKERVFDWLNPKFKK
ncbi:tubulin-specific chaperone C-like [Oratosquilla oratoria]|uniref:tubulin-specific chaperone C-like n=1 Tax=Oratosquilla oratoria TaxID=337810 RepID=UPI003F758630